MTDIDETDPYDMWAPKCESLQAELAVALKDVAILVREIADARASIRLHEKAHADLAAENERLRAELAEAQRDAARYRWLRGSPLSGGSCYSFDGLSLKCGVDLDLAIDAAMAGDKS